MGQLLISYELSNALDQAAHKPIHSYIAQIIPWLESRQHVAKRLSNTSILSYKTIEGLLAVIKHHDNEIAKILNMIPETKIEKIC